VLACAQYELLLLVVEERSHLAISSSGRKTFVETDVWGAKLRNAVIALAEGLCEWRTRVV
jgi:hypothetical protein